MIAIDNVLISDEVVSARFVCDLSKCKGGCCEDGDAGAPLQKEEMKVLNDQYEVIKPYMTPEGMAEIERQGKYVYDREFGWVTPTINGTICAYGFRNRQGVILCAIEQAHNEGRLEWKKPISCHLYPIKITKSKHYTMVNYEPREVLCRPACAFGKKLKVPVYQFLKDALVRQFGSEFYATLDEIAHTHYEAAEGKKKK